MMASDDVDMFAIRPDHKGPKTVAILLIVFSIFLGLDREQGALCFLSYMRPMLLLTLVFQAQPLAESKFQDVRLLLILLILQ